ncbi:MAG: hypothetical protein ABIP97_09190 [Chthoniobacterales bacterium]
MNSKCFPEVLSTAEMKNLGEGITGPVITAPLFLATKIEAFNDRGNADFFGSHDLEDIVTLIDGCEGIATQMEKVSPPIREHVSLTCTNFLLNRDFQDALPGHISAISGGAQRVDIILSRFQRIAK